LATFEQWFAARAIIENQVDVAEILTSLESFSRWRYVLAIVLAAAQPAQADAVMAALARWNPGAASWVVTETTSGGLTRSTPAMEHDEWESVGTRLRTAFEAWLDELGPLASAFWPYGAWGLTSFDDISLAVDVDGRSLQVWWLKRGECAGETPALVFNPMAIGPTCQDGASSVSAWPFRPRSTVFRRSLGITWPKTSRPDSLASPAP
jgi:hypothetical protein